MNLAKLVEKVSKQLNLSDVEEDGLLHDINNLRGNEWLDLVEENCDEETIKEFKKSITGLY